MRRRPLFTLVVVLLAVLVVAFVVDRLAVREAESRALAAVEAEADDVTGATIDIRGVPFLTQLLGGSLGHVVATAEEATFAGYTVSDLEVDARGVSTGAPYTVREGSVAALLPTGALERALRDQARLDADVHVDGDALALGFELLGLDLQIAAVPHAVGPETIALDLRSVTVGPAVVSVDDLPDAVAEQVTDLQVALDLPADLVLDGLAVEPGGLRVEVSGTDVLLDDLVSS